MSKLKKSAKENNQKIADAFTEQLKTALENFNKKTWLGEGSILTEPYFLGEYLLQQTINEKADAEQRVEILRRVIREVVEHLPEEMKIGIKMFVQARKLIKIRYIQGNTVEKTARKLNIGRAAFYRHAEVALNELGELLLQRLNPTLRSELPPHNPNIVGRARLIKMCLQGLQDGKTVGLTGPSGVGKTALGASISYHLAPQSTFWFTFRRGLNDNLKNLLFSLGYFLHHQGSSNLWRQLVAGGKIEPEMALGLIRYDLKQLQAKKSVPLLFCFDEVDLLHPETIEAHEPIVSFVEGLKGLTPILLMGQFHLIDPDVTYDLPDLEEPEIVEFLEKSQAQSLQRYLYQLQKYSRGNPRILEMLIALYHQSQADLREVLESSNSIPSLENLLERIWLRLSDKEQEILGELAVYQRPVALDEWDSAVSKLIERRLVQTDRLNGGVMLLKSFRDVIYKVLPSECIKSFHQHAAVIRAARGEYTAAIRHLIDGKKPDLAIWLWQRHQQQEIDQGQAATALHILQKISVFTFW
ncbi:hypothetical protein KFU94_00795 [Chloroflexi bacterium TSY]|nr:hypothetical protein [Chloroflexi bacterium TSY]